MNKLFEQNLETVESSISEASAKRSRSSKTPRNYGRTLETILDYFWKLSLLLDKIHEQNEIF